MKVELIDYTGRGNADPLYAARILLIAKSTRLNASERAAIVTLPHDAVIARLREVVTSIRSSWEFVDFTFEISGITRACADQLVRSRMWSWAMQTQRTVSMDHFGYMIPKSVYDADLSVDWAKHMEATRDLYKLLAASGVPAQDCRGVLPMYAHVDGLMGKTDLKNFCDTLGKRRSPRAQEEIRLVFMAMECAVLEELPWTDLFLNINRTETADLDALVANACEGYSPKELPVAFAAAKQLDLLKGTWG